MAEGLVVEWADGHITKVPEATFSSAGAPGRPAVRIEYRLDDLTRGLFVDISHWERPAQPVQAPQLAPPLKGSACRPVHDDTFQVFDAKMMEDVASVTLDGKRVLFRSPVTGTLINLHKVNAMAELYLETKDVDGVYDAIAALAIRLDRYYADRCATPEARRDNIILDLGIEEADLDAAIAGAGDVEM